MLVVISIIGILAALIIPAVANAMRSARSTTIASDLNMLQSSCENYKEKFGEYPPDFAGWDNTNKDPLSPTGIHSFPRSETLLS